MEHEKVKKALKTVFDAIEEELKGEKIESIEIRDADSSTKENSLHQKNTRPILEGLCHWDPIKRKVVCNRPPHP